MRLDRIKYNINILLVLLISSIFLSACSSTRDRLWLDADGWRRAVLAGTTEIADQTSFTLDEQGNAYFFLVEESEAGYFPKIVGLSRNAEEFTNITLDVVLENRPHDTGIFWDGKHLNLFWIENHKFMRISLDEKFSGDPVLLSNDVWVSNYSVAVDSDGELAIWYSGDNSQPSLYVIQYFGESAHSVLVDSKGYRPSLQFDSENNLLAIWVRSNAVSPNQSVFYGVYENGVFLANTEALIYQITRSNTDRIEGPKLGLDAKNGYLFWSVTHGSGLQAGSSNAAYSYFPLGRPQEISQPVDLMVPVSTDLSYSAPLNSGLIAGDRVLLSQESGAKTSNLTEISIIPGVADELAVSLRARLPYLRNSERVQVGVAFLNGGELSSYQLISYTITSSIRPFIIKDSLNHLYISWIESNDEDFNVFFSSTSPDIKSALSGISTSEALNIGAEMSFGMLSGMLLIYFPMMWMLVPGFLMLVTLKIRRPDEPLMSIGTIVSLGLSFAAYWFSKIFFLPDILSYTPFTTYMPMIPETWFLAIRISVILVITLFAGFIALKYTYGERRNSPFFALLIFMPIDGLLTMAFYGGAFVNAL